MTLTEHALRGAALEAGATNRLRVGLPWYRSMPFSSLVGIELLVDGVAAPEVRLDLDGRPFAVQELPELAGRYWFLQDRHALEWPGRAAMGEQADLVLRMRLHLPYLTPPDGGSIQVLQEVRAIVPVERAS